jgi:hypothetical protein
LDHILRITCNHENDLWGEKQHIINRECPKMRLNANVLLDSTFLASTVE